MQHKACWVCDSPNWFYQDATDNYWCEPCWDELATDTNPTVAG